MSDRLELVDGSGPVSPKFQHTTTIVVEGREARREHRDAGGATNDVRQVSDEAWKGVVDAIEAVVPLGTTLDLVGDKRNNKGIVVNHLTLAVDGKEARLEYLPSHVDDEHGDARVRSIVEKVRALFSPDT